MIYDVIVVGAGAGGMTAASLLARRGISTLLIDKTVTQRDVVRSDGLMPQAIYLLHRLGCAEPVLAAARGCIKACDLYVDGEHVLTGPFPDDTKYPGFAVLVVRKVFDEIMREYTLSSGVRLERGTIVRGIEHENDHVRVHAEHGRVPREFRGRIVIGADGSSSTLSRAIGNSLKDGVLGITLRTTFRNVAARNAGIRVHFHRDYFPSYGWAYIDDHGTAGIGIGRAVNRNFPNPQTLSANLQRLIDVDLADLLKDAERCGPYSGSTSGHFRPKSITADRVLLIGDAANQADPLNRGGIHSAMDGAFCAAEACMQALELGDFSRHRLSLHETLWSGSFETDWRMAEIFMSLALNPNLRDLALFLMKQAGALSVADAGFREFTSGIFSGVVPQSNWLTAQALYRAVPKESRSWKHLLNSNSRNGVALGSLKLASGVAANTVKAAVGLARQPDASLEWGLDLATRMVRLADRRIGAARLAGALTTEENGV